MKQIVSFEESKNLKESGVLIRAVFRYDKFGRQSLALADTTEYHLADEYYPSPTIGELIEWISGHGCINIKTWKTNDGKQVHTANINQSIVLDSQFHNELIDALVELAIKNKGSE